MLLHGLIWLFSVNLHYRVYNIGIEAKQGTGRYKDSTIVTFAPRYELDNQSSHKLAIAQAYTLEKEVGHAIEYMYICYKHA